MSLLRRVIGAVLRRIRLRQGRTLRDVAEAAGVSVPYLSEIERGRKEASSEVLASVCRALGIHLADLLEEARDEVIRLEPGIAPVRRPPLAPRVPLRPPAPRAAIRPAGRPAGPSVSLRRRLVVASSRPAR